MIAQETHHSLPNLRPCPSPELHFHADQARRLAFCRRESLRESLRAWVARAQRIINCLEASVRVYVNVKVHLHRLWSPVAEQMYVWLLRSEPSPLRYLGTCCRAFLFPCLRRLLWF